MKKAHLGILVRYVSADGHPPFIEHHYFKLLTLYGQQIGVDVTVFSPLHIDWSKHKVFGYRYHSIKKEWIKGYYPIPDVLYDRVAYVNRAQIKKYHPAIKRLTQEAHTVLLGRGLPGKWNVYNMIKDLDEIQPYLPETVTFDPQLDWVKKLQHYGSLFFKPASGSHGRSVFRLWEKQGRMMIQGRNAANKVFHTSFPSFQKAHQWMKGFIGKRIYVVQPYLELDTPERQPFDIRILFQKDPKEGWIETGRAVRVGKKESLTSNLDGGGTAVEPDGFLAKWYTKTQLEQINKDIQTILTHLPERLEKLHGPLIELGLDIGIDKQGQVWIIEVNSKPGRDSFKLSKNQEAYRLAIKTPMEYAKYVSQFGGRTAL